MTDKVILSNGSALLAKYNASDVKAITQAIRAMIASDKAKALTTAYIELDDAVSMQKYGGSPVTDAANATQNKRAVDAIYKALTPDYIVLLGSVDVIPHVDLTNPVYNANGDGDRVVPSDLPYACEAPYNLAIEKFISPTRVVGRLPDITGGADPSYLVEAIGTAASAKSRARSEYEKYLCISASVWEQSTALSLKAIFGASADEQVCPPKLPPWSADALGRLSHFINCHGASRSPDFYGQEGSSFPVSYDGAALKGKFSEGVVAAMECCYGAELYDPANVDGKQAGVGNTYLANKAYGYAGSTTIAYGPGDTNEWADLLCQYFFASVLGGASLGRAMLEARQKYVQTAASPLGPIDLKTLAQFILLGDPSIQPVAVTAPITPLVKGLGIPKAFGIVGAGARADRIERRKDLAASGLALGRTWSAVNSTQLDPPTGAVRKQMDALAKSFGMSQPSMMTFMAPAAPSRGAAQMKALMAKQPDVTAVHVMMSSEGSSENGVARTEALVVREAGGKILSVRHGFAKGR